MEIQYPHEPSQALPLGFVSGFDPPLSEIDQMRPGVLAAAFEKPLEGFMRVPQHLLTVLLEH